MTKATHKDERRRCLKFRKIQWTIPVTYKITDYNGEEIQGSFCEQDLQKTSQDVFRIEKILKRRGDKLLVKWMVYSYAFNSLVDSKAIVEKIYHYKTINKMLHFYSKLY